MKDYIVINYTFVVWKGFYLFVGKKINIINSRLTKDLLKNTSALKQA